MHHASTPTIYWYTYATRRMRPLLCADFIPIIEKDIKVEALVVTSKWSKHGGQSRSNT